MTVKMQSHPSGDQRSKSWKKNSLGKNENNPKQKNRYHRKLSKSDIKIVPGIPEISDIYMDPMDALKSATLSKLSDLRGNEGEMGEMRRSEERPVMLRSLSEDTDRKARYKRRQSFTTSICFNVEEPASPNFKSSSIGKPRIVTCDLPLKVSQMKNDLKLGKPPVARSRSLPVDRVTSSKIPLAFSSGFTKTSYDKSLDDVVENRDKPLNVPIDCRNNCRNPQRHQIDNDPELNIHPWRSATRHFPKTRTENVCKPPASLETSSKVVCGLLPVVNRSTRTAAQLPVRNKQSPGTKTNLACNIPLAVNRSTRPPVQLPAGNKHSPGIQTDSACKIPPVVNRDPPAVNRDPPAVNRDPPAVNRDPPAVNRDPLGIESEVISGKPPPAVVTDLTGSRATAGYAKPPAVNKSKTTETGFDKPPKAPSRGTDSSKETTEKRRVIRRKRRRRHVKFAEKQEQGEAGKEKHKNDKVIRKPYRKKSLVNANIEDKLENKKLSNPADWEGILQRKALMPLNSEGIFKRNDLIPLITEGIFKRKEFLHPHNQADKCFSDSELVTQVMAPTEKKGLFKKHRPNKDISRIKEFRARSEKTAEKSSTLPRSAKEIKKAVKSISSVGVENEMPENFSETDQDGEPGKRTMTFLAAMTASTWTMANYVQLLNNIASDLDVMLHDLCQTFPYGSSTSEPTGQPKNVNNTKRELELFEQYMESAALEDEVCSEGGATSDQHSAPSSDLDFFSAEENSSTTGTYFASSEGETPPPQFCAPSPPPLEQLIHEDRLLYLEPAYKITILERLIRTHPVWYLPNIGRAGSTHLLHNREPGSFLVRQSSQKDTMALTLRQGLKPRIEHYLIESTPRGLRVEGSQYTFPAIPLLIAHYSQIADELPVKLCLPQAVLQARSHQELASIALLGQDFWTSSISHMKQTSNVTPVVAVAPYQTGVTIPHTPVTMATQVHKATATTSVSSVVTNSEVSTRTAWVNGVQRKDQKDNMIFTTSSQTLEKKLRAPKVNSGLKKCKSLSPPPKSPSQPLKFMNGAMNLKMTSSETKSSSLNGTKSCDRHSKEKGSLHIEKRYYRGNLSDKLSDYEDICNMPEPKTESRLEDNVFRPIKNGRLEGGDVLQNGVGKEKNVVGGGGGHKSDAGGGGSGIIELRHITTENLERGYHNNNTQPSNDDLLRQVLKPKAEPQIFTFDFVSRGSPPKTQQSSLPNGLAPQQSLQHRERQYSSPSYAEPYDSRIGKVEGVTTTVGAIKVSNSLRTNQSDAFMRKQEANVVPSGGKEQSTISNDGNERNKPRLSSELHIQVNALNELKSMTSGPTRTSEYHSQFVESSSVSHTKKVVNGTTQFSDLNFKELNDVISDLQKQMSPPVGEWRSHVVPPTKVKSQNSPLNDRKALVSSSSNEWSSQSQSLGDQLSMISQVTSSQHSRETSRETSLSRTTQSHNSIGEERFINQNGCPRSESPESLPSNTKRNLDQEYQKSLHKPPNISPESTHYKLRPLPISKSFEENFFQENGQAEEQTATLSRFPVEKSHHTGSVSSNRTSFSESSTVEDLISDVSPDLTVKPLKPLTVSNLQRMSEYDNMAGLFGGGSRKTVASSVGTYYCKPWDSTLWDDLLHLGTTAHQNKPANGLTSNDDPVSLRSSMSHRRIEDADYSSVYMESLHSLNESFVPSHFQSEGKTDFESELATSFEWQSKGEIDSATDSLPRPSQPDPTEDTDDEDVKPAGDTPSCGCGQANKVREVNLQLQRQTYVSDDEGVEDDQEVTYTDSFKNRIMPFLAAPRIISMKSRGARVAGLKVRDYIFGLSQNKCTTFGATVQNFVQCTLEGAETNPNVVMRNIRQFMNGIKNYLIQQGEAKLNEVIETERNKLEADQFLNIDAIIEGALHKCVIKPLKQHIYKLFVEDYRKNGQLPSLSDNIKYARTKTPQELGIKPGIVPPQGTSMEVIKHFLNKMQKAYSPLKKLENLLGATSSIYNSVQGPWCLDSNGEMVSLGADDFLPMFIYVLVHCGMVSAEIEADYMWGLLHPCLLAGEGGYYLTTLSSAVHVLKHLKSSDEISVDSDTKVCLPSIGDLQGFMKIIIPDEKQDSILSKTLPVRPNMTAKDVCNMIAHKFRITNPQDYALYVLIKGIEDKLADTVCPQSIKVKLRTNTNECVFAYKRINANFIWPKNFQS